MKIGIIGAAGEWGSFITNYLSHLDVQLFLCDLNSEACDELAEKTSAQSTDFNTVAKECSIVILATPIDTIARLIKEIAPLMKENSLLGDIGSLKTRLIDSYEYAKQYNVELLSLHPLFGPVKDLMDQNCIYIPIKEGPLSKKIHKFLTERGIHVTQSTLEEHDQKVVYSQAILHHCMVSLNKLVDINFTTTNFRKVSEIVKDIEEHEDLFYPIIHENPYLQEGLDVFVKEVKTIEKTEK